MAFLYYVRKVCSATGYVRGLRISQLLWKLRRRHFKRFLIKSAVQELTYTNTIGDGHQLKLHSVYIFQQNIKKHKFNSCSYFNTLNEKSAILWIKHEWLSDLPLQLWGGGGGGVYR